MKMQIILEELPSQNYISRGSKVFTIGQVAQLVEQRTENPCVGGSIPPLSTENAPLYGSVTDLTYHGTIYGIDRGDAARGEVFWGTTGL